MIWTTNSAGCQSSSLKNDKSKPATNNQSIRPMFMTTNPVTSTRFQWKPVLILRGRYEFISVFINVVYSLPELNSSNSIKFEVRRREHQKMRFDLKQARSLTVYLTDSELLSMFGSNLERLCFWFYKKIIRPRISKLIKSI